MFLLVLALAVGNPSDSTICSPWCRTSCLVHNWTVCGEMVTSGEVDVAVVNSYQARMLKNLVPIAKEDPGVLVAVVKRLDHRINLWNLRGKKVCSSGFGDGWLGPMVYLRQTGQLEGDTLAELTISASEYFGPSCVPGVDEVANGRRPRTLCSGCYSKGRGFCVGTRDEGFFGDDGALRCLTEGSGEIAFVSHRAIQMNTDGRNEAEWSRHLRSGDFELVCKDGSRRRPDEWSRCHLGGSGSLVAMATEGSEFISWPFHNYH